MKAHELLADRSKWCRGARARSAAGKRVDPTSPDAARFCARQAILRCYPHEDRFADGSAMRRAVGKAIELFGFSLVTVNEELGYDAVMRVLREADV